MKTAKEKAAVMLGALKLYNPELKSCNDEINKNAIAKLLKEQDRDTRHACAENVLKMERFNTGEKTISGEIGSAVHASKAHGVIMNTRAV